MSSGIARLSNPQSRFAKSALLRSNQRVNHIPRLLLGGRGSFPLKGVWNVSEERGWGAQKGIDAVEISPNP